MDSTNKKARVTIYEVAKKAGVSLATVSRVINNGDNVSQESKDKVNKVIKELGYKPSALAQGLATSKTVTIGVVIPSANYVYISNLINGISEVAKEKGFRISLFTTSHSKLDAYKVIEDVIKSHVDGVIIFDDELTGDDIRSINSYSVPVIIINHNITGNTTGCILFNHDELIRKIILDNFAKNGKEMTFIHVHNGGRLLNRVEKVFIDIHNLNNKPYHIFNCDDSYSQTYEDFKEYFKYNKKGYFVAYRDSIAAAVINAAEDNGLNVPKDIEVISIIGTKYSKIIRPNISILYIDFNEVGKRACYMLVDLSNDELNKKVVKFETKINYLSTTL